MSVSAKKTKKEQPFDAKLKRLAAIMEHVGKAIDWLGRAKNALGEPFPVQARG